MQAGAFILYERANPMGGPTRISIFGLGYVGCVSAGCLAHHGHQVIGVDSSPEKVDALNAGRSPVIEPDLQDVIESAVRAGRLRGETDATAAVHASDVSFVCVGTPSHRNAGFDRDAIQRVCEQIGSGLSGHDGRHTVVVRSTLQPGDTEEVVIPALERASGKRAGRDFGVCFHPEFLREGTAIRDFNEPSRLLIGELDARSGAAAAALYETFRTPISRTSLRTAEMIKLVDNAFHALKVSFANEVGSVCKAAGIDGQEVMAIVAQDARVNRGTGYLTPGFAFGGSCLPKDMRALASFGSSRQVESPLLQAILSSNERHKERVFALIQKSGSRRVGVLGLSFKAGTDDLRDSPAVELVARLLREGYQVAVFDRQLEPTHLLGANRRYAEDTLPTLATLLRASPQAVLQEADVIVITQSDAQLAAALEQLRPEQLVIDLVRVGDLGPGTHARYEGICW